MAFIDFGIVGRVSPVTWAAVRGLADGLAANDYRAMATALVKREGGLAHRGRRTRLHARTQHTHAHARTRARAHTHTHPPACGGTLRFRRAWQCGRPGARPRNGAQIAAPRCGPNRDMDMGRGANGQEWSN